MSPLMLNRGKGYPGFVPLKPLSVDRKMDPLLPEPRPTADPKLDPECEEDDSRSISDNGGGVSRAMILIALFLRE
jgi:hypothetical protein